jgi:signal peptidase
MMHGTDSQVGTMDTGDLVLSKGVSNRDSIITYADGQKNGYKTYNGFGDVITFRANGGSDTPIIHRAIVWIEYNASGRNNLPVSQYLGSYDVPSLGLYNVTEFKVEGYEHYPYNLTVDLIPILENHILKNIPPHSGFITKGDNNLNVDQNWLVEKRTGDLVRPVKMEWVIGKAEGEIPWLGLVKLYLFGQTNDNESKAPTSSNNMLIVTFIVIIIILLSVHIFYIQRARRKRRLFEMVIDKKAEMFQKLIKDKRKSRDIGEENLLTKQEMENFSKDELLNFLENIVTDDKETTTNKLTIYNLKELAQRSKKNEFKNKLKEQFEKTSLQISDIASISGKTKSDQLEPASRPVSTTTTPLISKDDMVDIFNLFLELEVNNEIFGPNVSKVPIAKPVRRRKLKVVSGKKPQPAPMAKPLGVGNRAPLAHPVGKPVAKPIAKPVSDKEKTSEPAPIAEPVDKELIDELMNMLDK